MVENLNFSLDDEGSTNKDLLSIDYKNLSSSQITKILEIVKDGLEVSKKFGLELSRDEVQEEKTVMLGVFNKYAKFLLEEGSSFNSRNYESFLSKLLKEISSLLEKTSLKYFEIFKKKNEVTSKYYLHFSDVAINIYRYFANGS